MTNSFEKIYSFDKNGNIVFLLGKENDVLFNEFIGHFIGHRNHDHHAEKKLKQGPNVKNEIPSLWKLK